MAYSVSVSNGSANICQGGCARCNGKAKSGEALDECLCLHAEENALLEAGRERVGDGAVLYCNTYVMNLVPGDFPFSLTLSEAVVPVCDAQ